jgi:mono/diheme cytochrome c family protein
MPLQHLVLLLGGTLTALGAVPADDAPSQAVAVDYVRDVRPILAKHCHACHGPARQRSGLRLDLKAKAFQGGNVYGPAVVAGKPADSPLIQLVSGQHKDRLMPPKGERLAAAEVALLTAWVRQGAGWPDGVDPVLAEDRRNHWSFRPLTRPTPPTVADPAWPRNAIDRFVLARLEKEGLRPAPQADRVTWLRRVSLDLIGLPPTPEQVTAFVQDPGGDAHERIVERLLASPAYGERWAQHWLDVVRYADTHGFEVNTERPNAWPYRDYVIRAFNEDTPYDRFVREQLAGDALGRDAATGFLVTASVLLPGQIGQDAPSMRLARQDALDEIVSNTAQTFLGLSVGCARCHDHKFDPLSQRDYYGMQAFFAGVEYADRPLRTPEAEAARQAVFAGRFRTPDVTRLLHRGDPEQPGGEVAPTVPAVLGTLTLSKDAPEQHRRQALADWVASPGNPLTARVLVNRVWQGHFGTGLVETPSDFGHNGARPSHPDLLDWLAAEFLRSGWSVKHLHRLIVLSATYRQSGHISPAAQARDADDRLLWRFPSRRLEAEAVRDSMLAVSGRLNRRMGGPGFNLFVNRGGLTGFPPVESFRGDGLRRMIYAHRVRRERDAVFGALDCPDNGQSTARRRESTTPLQALNLFNSRFTIEEAAAFAARVRAEVGADPTRQVRRAYQLALGRDPDAAEIADAEPVVREHGLPTLSRALFNANEFLFLP